MAVAVSATVAACSSGGTSSRATSGQSGASGGGAATSPAGSSSAGNTGGGQPINLGISGIFPSLPVWIAQKEGFFAKNGVNVKVSIVPSLANVPAALGKSLDLGISVEPILIHARNAGLDIAATIAMSGTSNAAEAPPQLMAAGNSDVKGPQDLVGKRIGSPAVGGNYDLAISYWLKQHGVDPTKVHFVPVTPPNMFDQLKAGQIAAAEAGTPFNVQMQKGGARELVGIFAVKPGLTACVFFIGKTGWIKSHLTELAHLKSALDEANAFIKAHPDVAYSVAAQETKVPLAATKLNPLSVFTTTIPPSDIQNWLDLMKDVQGFQSKVPASEMVISP